MAHSTPRVEGGALLGQEGLASAIAVGTPAWYAWLEQATTFAFTGEQGSFTARKERSGRSGWYWKAYRKREGTLHHAYLGKAADLTLERLNAIASDLAWRTVERLAIESTIAVGAACAAPDAEAPAMPTASLPTGTLTFLFTDVEGSTMLWEQHKEAMPAALARHDTILREVVAAHGGSVFKTVGDSVHATFTVAADALTAALAAQRILATEPWGATGPLRVRMALHTGVAELRDDDYFGAPLNRVARILAMGHGGQILLSRATHDLIVDDLPTQISLRQLGAHQLKDLSRPEQIFQLISPDLPSEFPPLRTLDPRPAPAPAQPLALLATKLYVPLPRPNLVRRLRLVERVHVGLAGKFTLIAAPAGFGKTTLLAQGLEAWGLGRAAYPQPQASTVKAQALRVVWLALDAGDNDATRFWSYIIAGFQTIVPTAGATALALLQSLQPPSVEVILTTLLNDLSALTADAVLVLDDYHLIDTPAIHNALAFMLDHLPPQVHLVMSTRVDPPLPLTRLRARGDLTELRAADLSFTADEAAAFLTTVMGLPLTSDEVAALEARTEGWVAGLQLAALAMRDRADRTGFIAAFAGSNRFVVDYLAEEVIDRLPRHLQTFVLQTSILDRMCGPLCDAVLLDDMTASQPGVPSSQSAYSQALLEELERANLFLSALDDDRHWYRYHHLFGEVLRQRLISGASAAAVTRLHRRASTWFAERGLIAEAVSHAFAAGDVERAARLIEQVGASIGTQGQVYTVLGWLNDLPDRVIRAHPVLCIIHAAMLMYTTHLPAALDWLSDAERCVGADTPADQARGILGQVAVLRGNIARFVGDLASCMGLARQALELLPETEVFAHAGPLMRIGRIGALVDATYDFLVSGDATADVEQRVRATITAARAGISLFSTLRSTNLLARLQIMQGRLHAAAATYGDVAQVVPGQSAFQTLVNSAAYYFGMGELLHEWNDLDGAERYLAQGMELVRGTLTVDAHVARRGFLALAHYRQARGDLGGAGATLDEFMDLARRRNFVADLSARITAARARLALVRGDLAAAVGWAHSYAELRMKHEELRTMPEQSVFTAHFSLLNSAPVYRLEYEDLVLARVLIAEGERDPAGEQLTTALSLLEQLLAAAESGGRMGSAIEILVLRALALQAYDDTTSAMIALDRALTLAEPEGYIRIFVDEGPPMADLLQEAHMRGIMPEYVARLLAAFGKDEGGRMKDEVTSALVDPSSFIPQPLLEPLTDRELEVLRLMAAGRSNTEIAQALVVAVSTIKTHVNRIFGKLGATSRTQAVAHARDLHLL